MTPEERQMLADLFDRIRGQANGPRDMQAEGFIADAVRAQPYAPYLLAQTVLVQQQALEAATAQIKSLQDRVQSLESTGQAPQSGSFLGNLGKSIFGGSSLPTRGTVPNYAPPPSYNSQPSYAPPPANPWGQPQAGPWAQQQASPWSQPQAAPASGGFLKGALGAAAGVAGGVLLADGIRDLFAGAGHRNSFTQLAGIDTTGGIGSGGLVPTDVGYDTAAGMGGGGGGGISPTDVGYDPSTQDAQDRATDQQFDQDIANDPDYSNSDDGFNSNDDSFNV
jgi:hypothetical protein